MKYKFILVYVVFFPFYGGCGPAGADVKNELKESPVFAEYWDGYTFAQKNKIESSEKCKESSRSFVEGCQVSAINQQRSKNPVSVVLVIDRSSSMVHVGKIQGAKEAVFYSYQVMGNQDYFGLIGFDYAPFVILDVEKVSNLKNVRRKLEKLTAAGRTNLLPALGVARQKLRSVSTSRKHIIVLSDGKFPLESEAYVEEINLLRKEEITVSAVALGIGADVPFMKLIARYGRGAFYHTLDPDRLPQIFIKDIVDAISDRGANDKKGNETTLASGSALTQKVDASPIESYVVEKYDPPLKYRTLTAVEVRTAPSTLATSLSRLESGTAVHVTRSMGDWLELRSTGGRVGFIHSKDAQREH